MATGKSPAVVEDFDAFWAEHSAATDRPRVRIRGVEILVPFDMPFDLARRIEQADTADEATMRELLAQLYGEDVLDRWVDAGMGGNELSVVMAWSMLRAQGLDVSFAEAAEKVAEARELGKAKKKTAPAKPLPPLTRKANPGTKATRSNGTGRSSSRTSRASTASTSRRSRA